MKKLILLLFLGFLTSLHSCDSIFDQFIKFDIDFNSITAEELYDYVKSFLIGLSKNNENNETQCLEIYKKNSTLFINSITTVLDMVKKNQTIDRVISKIGLNIIVLKGFARNCNLLNLIPLYKTLSDLKIEDLKEFNIPGKLLELTDLSDDIYAILHPPNNTAQFYHLGKAFGYLFNFKIR